MKRQASRGRGKAAQKRRCGTKVAYPSREAAVASAAAIARQTGGRRMEAYRCNFCSLPDGARPYHLGGVHSFARALRARVVK